MNPSVSSSIAAGGGAGNLARVGGDVSVFLMLTRRGDALEVATGARVRGATRGAAAAAIAFIVVIVAAAMGTQNVSPASFSRASICSLPGIRPTYRGAYRYVTR
jgi:hypothetical protein